MTNAKLKSLGKNYLGKNILFKENETNKVYDDISSILMSDIYDKELSVSKGKELLNKIYSLYDKGNEQFEKYASCKKGCGACCCLYVDCTAIEAELIRDYIQANFSDYNKEIIMSKIKNLLSIIPSPDEVKKYAEVTSNHLSKQMPCAFLSNQKTCLIYPVRPFNCRKFLSISSPDKCDVGEHIDKISPSINNIGVLSINVLSSSVVRYRKLIDENNNNFKALHRAIPLWIQNGFNEIYRLK